MKRTLRILSVMLISVLMLSLVVGCGSTSTTSSNSSAAAAPAAQSSAPAPAAEKVKIRVETTFTGEDPFTTVWNKVLGDFKTKYPNIEVVDEATPAAGDAFKTKINTDVASGNEPDVIYGFNGAIGKPIVDSGKYTPWEDYLAQDSAWASNFMPAALDAVKYNGKIYALPFDGFFEGMWINKDVFANNGLDIPKTYDDIVKDIPVLKKADITPMVCSFAEEPHYIIETFVLSLGGKQGHDTDWDPSWAPALNFIKDLYQKGAFTADALTIKQAQCAQLFADKKAAMFISGSWSEGQFTDKQNTAVIPLPLVPGAKADPTDVIGGYGSGWYMDKELNDKKNGAALTFIKFMTSPEVEAQFVATAGTAAIKCTLPGDANTPVKASGVALLNNAKSISSPLGDRINQEAFTTIWKGLSYVVTGNKTADQLIAEAKKIADSKK